MKYIKFILFVTKSSEHHKFLVYTELLCIGNFKVNRARLTRGLLMTNSSSGCEIKRLLSNLAHTFGGKKVKYLYAALVFIRFGAKCDRLSVRMFNLLKC